MKITKEQFHTLIKGDASIQLADEFGAQYEVTEDMLSSVNHSVGVTSASTFYLLGHLLFISHVHHDGKFAQSPIEVGRFEIVRPATPDELKAKLI